MTKNNTKTKQKAHTHTHKWSSFWFFVILGMGPALKYC